MPEMMSEEEINKVLDSIYFLQIILKVKLYYQTILMRENERSTL